MQSILEPCLQRLVPCSMCIMRLTELQQQLAHGIAARLPGTALLLQHGLGSSQKLLAALLPLLHGAAACVCEKLLKLWLRVPTTCTGLQQTVS